MRTIASGCSSESVFGEARTIAFIGAASILCEAFRLLSHAMDVKNKTQLNVIILLQWDREHYAAEPAMVVT